MSRSCSRVWNADPALNVHEQQLGELIGNFDTFLGSASRRSRVERERGRRAAAEHAAHGDGRVHRAGRGVPGDRALRAGPDPGLEEIAGDDRSRLPWIAQTRGLLGPEELGGVAAGCAARRRRSPSCWLRSPNSSTQLTVLSKCLTKVFFPAGKTKLQDGANTSGRDRPQEFWSRCWPSPARPELRRQRQPHASWWRRRRPDDRATADVACRAARQGLADGAPTALTPLGTSPRFAAASRRISRSFPATRSSCPNSTARWRMGPADGSGG